VSFDEHGAGQQDVPACGRVALAANVCVGCVASTSARAYSPIQHAIVGMPFQSRMSADGTQWSVAEMPEYIESSYQLIHGVQILQEP
jgi:hypothetical protein